jgi:ArsR family transcriptional regulator, arsenate/arsenite/antimonite-responsive transcriptional repressor
MSLRVLRQIMGACADDTRLRIISVLSSGELSVSQICFLLDTNQPTVSKHLGKLRLLKIVFDKRQGNQVYYKLNKDKGTVQGSVISFITSQFKHIKVFQKDKKTLKDNK